MAEEKQAKKKKKWPWIVGGVVLLFIVIGAVGSNNTTQNTSSTDQNKSNENKNTETKTTEPEKKKISIDEVYGKIETGMTEAQVEQIVTTKPLNCTESEMQGFGTSKLCTYGNVFTDNVSIMVTYNNGKVFSKTKTQY